MTYKIFYGLLAASCLMGCSTCKSNSIKSVPSYDKEWTADIEYRVCGYVSGFTVAVYRTKSGPPGHGEGGKEPFQASIRTSEPYSYEQPPISIEWTGDRSLLIHHDTRMRIEDTSTKLKVTRANTKYEDITISYVPKPVIWD